MAEEVTARNRAREREHLLLWAAGAVRVVQRGIMDLILVRHQVLEGVVVDLSMDGHPMKEMVRGLTGWLGLLVDIHRSEDRISDLRIHLPL